MDNQQLSNKKQRKFKPLFWLTVVFPTIVSIGYFGFIASDIYTSESSFVVRSANGQSSTAGIGAIFQNVGISRSQDDTFTVQSFMRSRSALQMLEKDLPIRSFYETKGDILQRFNAFGFSNTEEAFYQYFQRSQSVSIDSTSGIATLRVDAFAPEEGQKINAELLKQGEALINRLNERARKDTITFAEQSVKDAESQVSQTADELSNYRIKNGIFDVQAQSEVQLNLVAKLQSELISIQTQLNQIRTIAPDNPQVTVLKAREESIKAEIQQQTRAILGKGKSIANQTAEYQRLTLANTIAQQQLTTAITSLHNAKAQADRQQLYLEVISPASKPDMALKPQRLYNILATFFIGLIIYGVASLLIASVREHKN